MKEGNKQDGLSSLFWLGVAIFICFGSIRLSVGDLHNPGPGFFSLIAGGILGFFSIIVFWKSPGEKAGEKRNDFWPDPQGVLNMTWVIIALIVYAVGMNYLGFFPSTLLFLGFLLRWVGQQMWRTVIVISILVAIISYGIFQYWLDVQLPRGIWGV